MRGAARPLLRPAPGVLGRCQSGCGTWWGRPADGRRVAGGKFSVTQSRGWLPAVI